MRSLALVMFAMACGGSASSAEPPIERAGFDLSACGAGKSTFDGITSFLGALDAADAAFLAEIATRGRVDCARPSVRKVDRGFEVITTTVQMCGGGRSEQRVFVSATGIASVRETRVLDRGEEMICP